MSTARVAFALAVLLSACGTDPSPGDDVGPDAVSGPPVTIDVLPLCQAFTWEAKVGQVVRQRTTNRVAVFDHLGPTSAFSVETCAPGWGAFAVPTRTCPAGSACTGSTGPGGSQCVTARSSGTFVGGKLTVLCGRVDQTFTASGAEETRSEIAFDSVRLTTY